MNYETLLVNKDERGVVSLTLNRPDKRNALSAKMIDELTNFAASLTSDVRVTVIGGAGNLFCAGGDLEWMNAQIKADRSTRIAEARKLAFMLKALNELPELSIEERKRPNRGTGKRHAVLIDES